MRGPFPRSWFVLLAARVFLHLMDFLDALRLVIARAQGGEFVLSGGNLSFKAIYDPYRSYSGRKVPQVHRGSPALEQGMDDPSQSANARKIT